MKRLIFVSLLFIVALLTACDSNDDTPNEQGTVAVFIVDYTSNELQSGSTLNVAKVVNAPSQLPVSASITQPRNDLNGSVSLLLTSTGDQLFDGELSDEGTARIFAPNQRLAPSDFFQLETPIPFPTQLNLLDIEGPYSTPFSTTWEAIDDINLIQIFLNEGGLMGRYLYQPSPNISSEWKWIIIQYLP